MVEVWSRRFLGGNDAQKVCDLSNVTFNGFVISL